MGATMRSTIPRPRSEEEWLDLRHHYWNASDTAALFNDHPFATLADVAVRKITTTNEASSAAMRRGQHLEEAIAQWWSDEAGIAVHEPLDLYVYEGLVMATLDRRLVGSDTDALEVKTTSRHVSGPERYWWWQCQAQALCAGLERVHIACLDGSMDLQSWTVEADRQAAEAIAEAAAKAMDFIRRGEVPPEAQLVYRHYERLHPRPTITSVELTDEMAEQVAWLGRIRTEKKALDQAEEQARTAIAAALGDAASGTWEGQEIVSWRSVTRRNLDADRLRKEQPEIHREYLVESSYRVMRITSQTRETDWR